VSHLWGDDLGSAPLWGSGMSLLQGFFQTYRRHSQGSTPALQRGGKVYTAQQEEEQLSRMQVQAMPGKWVETGACQVWSIGEPSDDLAKAKRGGAGGGEDSAKGARYMGVSDGLPQACALSDSGDQLDGGAHQGDRGPGRQDKRGGG